MRDLNALELPPNCPMFFEMDGKKYFSIYEFHATDKKSWSHDSDFPIELNTEHQNSRAMICAVGAKYWELQCITLPYLDATGATTPEQRKAVLRSSQWTQACCEESSLTTGAAKEK